MYNFLLKSAMYVLFTHRVGVFLYIVRDNVMRDICLKMTIIADSVYIQQRTKQSYIAFTYIDPCI